MYSMNRSFEDNWVMEKIEDERHIEMVSIRDADIISAAHTEHSSNTGPFGKYMASAYYQTKKLIEALIPNSLLSLRKHDFKDLKDPVYLLGKLYCKEAQVEFVEDEVCADLKEICEAEIFSRFRQILWFTYRSGFPRITNSKYESDVGWGCMLRTAQMILAECINRAMNFSCPKDQLISMFLDNEDAPLSIHRFVQLGMIHLGKQAGKWFGPSEASILAKYSVSDWKNRPMNLIVNQEAAIYSKEIRDNLPCAILVPVRLGLEYINPEYFISYLKFPLLFSCLKLKQSVGIIGGKPNSSLYFTGFQDKRLLYLDPHSVQNFTPLPLSVEDEKSYFCPNIRSLPISQLDPCMAIGFFCLNEQDLSGLWAELEELQRYSVFTLAESKPEYIKAWEDDQAFQVCDWNEICGGENHDRNSGHKDSYHDEDDEREIDGFVLCK